MTYKCKFCNKEFVRESTLVSHMCEKKRRKSEENNKQNRIAFQAWLLFRKITTHSKKEETYDQFIDGRYYVDFMKLSKHIIDLNIDDPNEFVKFLLNNNVKINDWTKAIVYETYIKDKTKKETVERAVERSIINMKKWADKTGNKWKEYFIKVSTIDAVQDIRMGRISPWCTFSTDQGSKLIDRMEPGQIQALIDYMEPERWRIKVKRQQKDADWVQQIFNEAEIV